jgi:CheY-like chemotaxis protein
MRTGEPRSSERGALLFILAKFLTVLRSTAERQNIPRSLLRGGFKRRGLGEAFRSNASPTVKAKNENQENGMQALAMLRGKKVLIVDDEPDILEMLSEELEGCELHQARDFESARHILETEGFDCVVLDIMGVQGYDLLEIAASLKIPAVMLTAHALSPEHFIRSIQSGAHCYVPKDKIMDINFFIWDAIRAHRQHEKRSGRWFERLRSFFEKKFGPNWRNPFD